MLVPISGHTSTHALKHPGAASGITHTDTETDTDTDTDIDSIYWGLTCGIGLGRLLSRDRCFLVSCAHTHTHTHTNPL
jgi:hypothetical protein